LNREHREVAGGGRRRARRAGIAVPVAIALAALLGACGGGSGSGSSGGAASEAAQQPLEVAVAPGQLPVAEELGPDIVAAEVTVASGKLALKLHTLTGTELPAAIPISLVHAKVTGSCGLGCYRARAPAATSTLVVKADIGGTAYTAQLPIGFDPGGDRLAQTLLRALDAGQVKLRWAAVHQSLRSSPTQLEITNFQIGAPDRFAYQISLNGRPLGDTIVVGRSEWGRGGPKQAWQAGSYGSQPFSAADYLDWWNGSDGSPRLLDLRGSGSNRVADIATVTMVPQLGPVWMRFHVDVAGERLVRFRMITVDHFMTQTWNDFNVPQRIEPPTSVAAAPSA
jgi:hypothetical protein